MIRYKIMSALLGLSLFLSACLKPVEPEKLMTDWTVFKFPGLNLDLIDDDEVQQMWFVEDGEVIITLGRRSSFLTAPVFNYTVSPDKIVILDNKKIVDELSLVSASSNRVTAKRKSGKIGHYKILP